MDKHERTFDVKLGTLKNHLLRMATVAEGMVDEALGALVRRDETGIPDLNLHEDEINRLQIEIDEEAMTLLATQQPVATDLRFIIAAVKINGELERIGDLAINIADNVHTLVQQPPLKPLIDIPRMGDLARAMIREALGSFIANDPLQAQRVILNDDKVDDLRDQVVRELITYMLGDPRTIERALALILIVRHLERIADHATNIAEDIIYMSQGRDVRHPRVPREEGRLDEE